MHMWSVVPVSKGQSLDVRKEDLIHGGLYRACDVYRGGGGYDQFPVEFKNRYHKPVHKQFIVQLRGCNLDCPYCYVTREGVWGAAVVVSTAELVSAYKAAVLTHGVEVFHLMGGAPALQIKFWPELIQRLKGIPFHSDLMLSESEYKISDLEALRKVNCLYAVNIKGTNPAEYFQNTRKQYDGARMVRNLAKLELAKVPYYFTFTNIREANRQSFLEEFEKLFHHKPSYHDIDLISYNALAHVDDVEWGSAIPNYGEAV